MAAAAKPVDYDQIAPTYDQRYHTNRLEGVEDALLALIRKQNVQRVLEAGCGTGRWLGSLPPVVPHMVGLDLSMGMLRRAYKKNQGCDLVNGRGGQLPFRKRYFDLVFCVNALHHFKDPLGFISNAWASLEPGGFLVIVGQVPQERPNRWFVYDYFEGTYETDLKRFHTWDTVKRWMKSAGFERVWFETVEKIQDHKSGTGVFDDPFLKKNATSQLAQLSNQAYDEGINRIRNALKYAEMKGETLVFQVDLRLDMLTGQKTGNI